MPENLRLDFYLDALRGDDVCRRFMAVMLDSTARLVGAGAGMVYSYDDRGQVTSPAVVKPSEEYSHPEAVALYEKVFASGVAERSLIAGPIERLGDEKVVGTAELGGEGPGAPSDYWAYNLALGVVSQLVVVFRDEVRIVGGLVLSRMHEKSPFSAEDRGLLLALQPVLESGFILALANATLEDRVDGFYGRTLTGREREVASLVARGASNQRIASTLVISEATVKTHLNRIFAKVGVSSRTQLAKLVRPEG